MIGNHDREANSKVYSLTVSVVKNLQRGQSVEYFAFEDSVA
jgi:hypothetical protein